MGDFVQIYAPTSNATNGIAPPEVWRYCVPSVSKPIVATMIFVKLVNAEFGTWTALMNRIHISRS